jgi:hypothetical protein
MEAASSVAGAYSAVMWMESFGQGGVQNSQKMHFL